MDLPIAVVAQVCWLMTATADGADCGRRYRRLEMIHRFDQLLHQWWPQNWSVYNCRPAWWIIHPAIGCTPAACRAIVFILLAKRATTTSTRAVDSMLGDRRALWITSVWRPSQGQGFSQTFNPTIYIYKLDGPLLSGSQYIYYSSSSGTIRPMESNKKNNILFLI